MPPRPRSLGRLARRVARRAGTAAGRPGAAAGANSARPAAAAGRPLRLAFLGCGAITAVYAKALARLGLPVEPAFASRDGERARAYAADFGGRALPGYEEAMADRDIDAVFVATTPNNHADLALAALAHGKDVIVEKPAFLRTEDFDAVGRAADEAGRRVLVAENHFYKPLRRRLEALIRAGVVGDPLFVCVSALKRKDDAGWRGDRELSGGPLLEGGVHWIDLMANLGLEPVSASARAAGPEPGRGRSTQVTLEYAEGTVGVLLYSWEAHTRLGGVMLSRIHGTQGAIAFESNGALVVHHGRAHGAWSPRPSEASGSAPMLRDFVGALRSGRPAAFTLAHARRDVALIEEAQGSTSPRRTA